MAVVSCTGLMVSQQKVSPALQTAAQTLQTNATTIDDATGHLAPIVPPSGSGELQRIKDANAGNKAVAHDLTTAAKNAAALERHDAATVEKVKQLQDSSPLKNRLGWLVIGGIVAAGVSVGLWLCGKFAKGLSFAAVALAVAGAAYVFSVVLSWLPYIVICGAVIGAGWLVYEYFANKKKKEPSGVVTK